MNTHGLKSILVAEDEETDVILLRRAFQTAGFECEATFVDDGEHAVTHLKKLLEQPQARLPALVILDLKMPRMGGLDVLNWMRAQPIVRGIPAVIFSSSTSRRDINEAYEAGASAYLLKPASMAERAKIASFLKEWLGMVQLPVAAVDNIRLAQLERAIIPVGCR